MAANTVSAWTESRVGYTGGSLYKASCTVLTDTANTDASTLKTPIGLNVRRPWSLVLYASATPDGSALPVDLWMGYAADFVMSNDGNPATATSGCVIKQIIDDAVLALTTRPFNVQFVPHTHDVGGSVADVVAVATPQVNAFKSRIPVAPYYAISLNGASTLNAVTWTFIILQS